MSRAEQTARWIARPGPFLFNAHREFGDVFTIRIGTEPPWAVLAHPDAVREVFTGDAAALHAGKANLVLLPFLGSSSVLLLDGPTHLRQRKLMLPPFHGKRMAGYEDDVRRIAREHVAAWPRDGALKLAPRLQAITLDVVLRVIFGVREHDAALGELRARLRAHDGGGDGRAVAARAARARPPAHRRARRLPARSCGPSTSCCCSRSPPAAPTRATTCSRCCSPRATRTAAR